MSIVGVLTITLAIILAIIAAAFILAAPREVFFLVGLVVYWIGYVVLMALGFALAVMIPVGLVITLGGL